MQTLQYKVIFILLNTFKLLMNLSLKKTDLGRFFMIKPWHPGRLKITDQKSGWKKTQWEPCSHAQNAYYRNFAAALLSMFSSTYACESLFSDMNFIKSRNRSSLTDETSSSCISLKVTRYKPNVKSLSAVMQQHKSRWSSTRKVKLFVGMIFYLKGNVTLV